MKQTIISKCFDKMKRVVLTLFAALCVGSAWAEEGEVTYLTTPLEDPSAGYIRTGLGDNGNEVAVVFTNHTKELTWTVPANLYNVEFLVVGGGGGGGAENGGSDERQAGGGGGGGGVVTGAVSCLERNSVVTIKVGAGGAGGVPKTKFDSSDSSYGASGSGDASYFEVDDVEYVYVFGGGGDGGAKWNAKAGAQGKTGGSSGGSRPGCTTLEKITPARTNNVALAFAESFGNQGGAGYDSNSYYGLYAAAGGGGGATESGFPATGTSSAGNGGQGLLSDIIGVPLVYGSGGGGATVNGLNGGFGGEGAGDGNTADRDTNSGANAQPNQGGGGGGASREGNGGAGGSGIVVFRYRTIIRGSDVEASITPVQWTGEYQVSNLVNTEMYTVTCEPKKDVGQGYELTVTPKSPWTWEDGTHESKVFSWEIIKADNAWVNPPVISATSWIVGGTDKITLTTAEDLQLRYGDKISVTISKNGGDRQDFDGHLPTEIGQYTLTYTAPAGETYNEFVYELNFAINDHPIVQVLPNSVGYKYLGLGLNNDEVAVVFTTNAIWQVPADLENVEFLVVGGGGGGGADNHWDDSQGGAGGGGGGVVTGVVTRLNKDAPVAVTVGSGGVGGSKARGKPLGSSANGGDTEFKVSNVSYVKAFGGGGDGGASSDTATTGNKGKEGGSSGGSRAGQASVGNVKSALVNNNDVILCYKAYGNSGGAGNTSTYKYYGHQTAAGGGGGAMHEGYPAQGTCGGNGGEGLVCAITGQVLDYGSGGGGASIAYTGGYAGGEGAGDARTEERPINVGEDALPNRGGGGGGGCRTGDKEGGNGGSGVVVLRYKTTIHTVKLPEIANATWYNGANQVTEFKVEEGTSIPLTLKAADGYFFENGTGEMVFNVGQNGTSGEAPQYRPAVAKIGDVKYSLLSAALDNAVAGAEIKLVAESLELSDNMAISKNVTLNLGNNTLTIPDDKTVTVNTGVALTIKCGTGGLVVDGDIAVNGTLDISELSYGATGLIANKAGSLKIGATGIVKLMNAWDAISPNWMMANNTSFFNGTAAGAKLIQGVTTNTFTSGVWVKPNHVAYTMIRSNGYEFLEGFDTLEDALENAVISDEVNNEVKLLANIEADEVEVPNGVTLNLNGMTFKGDALGVVAVNKGTYITPQDYKMVGPDAHYYMSTNAVLTIGATSITLNSGSLEVVPDEWWTLPGQTLTIAEGAEFIIPDGKKMNNNGSTVVINGTLSGEGAINLYSLDATVQGAEGLKVTTTVEGYKVQYADDKYTLVPDWTAPRPTPEGTAETTAKYDQAVSDALANVEAQSITVTVNGEQKFGNAAVEALNTAFACFADKDGNPLVFANAAATLDIEIKVTEVNTTEPWKSKVEVTRDGVPITVKATPTVKYFYPDTTEKWQDTAPTSGAVLFKLVFEAK